MLCYKYGLHTKATVKKVAGAPEVPQVPAANPEAGIKHQDSLSKSREEQAKARRDIPSCSRRCILGRGCCGELCLPIGGQLDHTIYPFCLRIRVSFIKKKKKRVSCIQPSLSSCLGTLVPSPCSLNPLCISYWGLAAASKMFLGLGNC